MRLLVLSDLHFEFQADKGRAFAKSYAAFDDYDVAIVAGDLCDFETLPTALGLIADHFKRVVYVSGNHECFGASIPQTLRAIDKLLERTPHVAHLKASSTVIDGQRFVGGTLWWHEDVESEFYEDRLEDFERIHRLSRDVATYNERAEACLDKWVDEHTVVVTHHLPSTLSVPERYVGHDLNRFFVCDQERFIAERRPQLWIHGHTHDSADYHLGATRVVCNPLGYAYRPNRTFIPQLTIEV